MPWGSLRLRSLRSSLGVKPRWSLFIGWRKIECSGEGYDVRVPSATTRSRAPSPEYREESRESPPMIRRGRLRRWPPSRSRSRLSLHGRRPALHALLDEPRRAPGGLVPAPCHVSVRRLCRHKSERVWVALGPLAQHVHIGECFFGGIDVLRSRFLKPELRLLVILRHLFTGALVVGRRLYPERAKPRIESYRPIRAAMASGFR